MSDNESRVRSPTALFGRILLYLVCLLSLLGFVGGNFLPFELASHFRPHYFLVLSVGALWLLVIRRWRTFVSVFLFASFNGLSVAHWYISSPGDTAAAHRTSVRLLLANVHTTNLQYGLILEQIAREDPDIVILQETDSRWLAALEPLEESYGHRLLVARGDNFGIALYSRIPLSDLRVAEFGTAAVPSILGTLQLSTQAVTLIATHPLPPISFEHFAWRNEQLEAVARYAAAQPQVIVIGDLNLTMWSHHHAKLEQSAGLCNVRRGHGLLPTWPVGLGPLMIPLDHCLISSGIIVESVRIGTETGADHLPLIVDLGVL